MPALTKKNSSRKKTRGKEAGEKGVYSHSETIPCQGKEFFNSTNASIYQGGFFGNRRCEKKSALKETSTRFRVDECSNSYAKEHSHHWCFEFSEKWNRSCYNSTSSEEYVILPISLVRNKESNAVDVDLITTFTMLGRNTIR